MINKKFIIFIFLIFIAIFQGNPAFGEPLINSFEMVCNDELQPGDGILLTVKGSPGGEVWIEISNVSIKIYLPEISPGIYQGNYILTPDLPSIYRAMVFAHLQLGGIEATPVPGGKKITIKGTGPLFYDLSPPDETLVRNLRPTIYAAIDGRGRVVDMNSLRIIVNRQDVTQSYETILNTQYITFMPASDMKEGENRVYMYGKTTDGTEFSIEWNFFIKMSSSINSVSHNAKGALTEGDILEVHLIGDPYQKAYFDIGNWKKNIPMNESFKSPGTYIGTYTVQKEDYVAGAPIVAYLDIKGGGIISSQASSTVTIMANELVVRIFKPEDGDTVFSPFTIKGQTRPFTLVHLDILLTFIIPGIGVVPAPNVMTIEITSNEMGFFEYNVNIPNVPPGSEFKISATAIDAQGNKSAVHTVKYYQQW